MDLIKIGLSDNEYRENAIISFSHKYTDDGIWHYGTWFSGTWVKGIWVKGHWNDGLWCDGIWYNGTWRTGIWNKGLWFDGTWENGCWYGGYWLNGKYTDGLIEIKTGMYHATKVSPKSYCRPKNTLCLNHASYI